MCPPGVFMQTFAGDRLLGIQLLPLRLARAVYRDSLGKVLPKLLQDVDLQTMILLWFMRDGSQPHFLLAIWILRNNVFPRNWIGWGCPTKSPARFPALALYSSVVTICTASLTFNNSTFCSHNLFMCFVWIWEQTAIISLYSINWLVFITEIYPFTAQRLLYVPSGLTFNISTFCSHSAFMCFVWISE